MNVRMTKSATAQLKAAGQEAGSDLAQGEFKALVSVFNNVDSYGDVVMPGAFAHTIKKAESTGDPIPVIWSHQWEDPWAHLGQVVKAEETDEGLLITGQIDTSTDMGEHIFKLLKARRVRQFSFAFDIRPDGAGWGERTDPETGAKYEVFELRDLDLHEVGPCLVGVNRETQLESVKAAHAAFSDTPHRDKSTTAPPAEDTSTTDGTEKESSGHAEGEAASGEAGGSETPAEGSETSPPASSDDGTASVDLLQAELALISYRED